MTELVFSTQRRGFEKGRHYQNPKYFEGRFREGVTHVYVLGNWPKVVQAAEAFGIACTQLREGAPISWKDGIAPTDPSEKLVEIPKTWPQFGHPRLIALAAEIAKRDVANRKQAVRIIEDELDRRVKADEHQTPPILLPDETESPSDEDQTDEKIDESQVDEDQTGDDEESQASDEDGEEEEAVEKPTRKSKRNRRK